MRLSNIVIILVLGRKSTIYLRILDMSSASCSENTGTALDLCRVAIPIILSPEYTGAGFRNALPTVADALGSFDSLPLNV